jgi:PRC-barrel domain protein
MPHHQRVSSLIGAQIIFGSTPIGHVQSVQLDPVSDRVRRLVTTYGIAGRRVAVPMEWVVRTTPGRVRLGVGAASLDDLADQTEEAYVSLPLAPPSLN